MKGYGKKLATLLLSSVLALGMMTGCGKKESAESTEAGKYGLDMDTLTVAVSPGYEPFMYKDGDKMVGYDADLLAEFEKRSGIKVKYEEADFSGLLGLVQSGKADVVSAQLTPTPEREEVFAVTEPETYYGSVVVVAEDNNEIKSVKDLAGKKIGTGAGNEMQKKVEDMYKDSAEKPQFEIYTSATLENMLDDVEYGRIDGFLAQNVQAYMAIEKSGAKCKVLEPFESSVGCMAVDKKNEKLLNGLNEFLKEIKEDGTLKEISEKWVGYDISTESK